MNSALVVSELPVRALSEILLTVNRTVTIGLDAAMCVKGVHNPLLLDEWRGRRGGRDHLATLGTLLDQLMPAARARELEQQIEAGLPGMGPAGLYLAPVVLCPVRGGSAPRHVAASLHRTNDAGGTLALVLRDVTALAEVEQRLEQTDQALDAAMAALRTQPNSLRAFLVSARTSLTAIRTLLRSPARNVEALRDKLTRLLAFVAQLAAEAGMLQLTEIQRACHVLHDRAAALEDQDALTGDAVLPVAALVDALAGSLGTLWRIEEQRHCDAPAKPARVRRRPDWTSVAERRWSSLLRHRAEELGVLVTLQLEGAAHVPKSLRGGVDKLLQDMLRNAVEHGIETPEERLAAQKPATGTLLVKFEQRESAQLRMTVRDDGRGRGLGLTSLRRVVARLGGNISVAAKPHQYTQFVIDLPLAMAPAIAASQ